MRTKKEITKEIKNILNLEKILAKRLKELDQELATEENTQEA